MGGALEAIAPIPNDLFSLFSRKKGPKVDRYYLEQSSKHIF
jgi:hypothetical protein